MKSLIEFKAILHMPLQVNNLNKRWPQEVLLAFLTFSFSCVFTFNLMFPWSIQDHSICLFTFFICSSCYTFKDYRPFKNLHLFLITFYFSFFKVLPQSIIHLHFHQLPHQFHLNQLSFCRFQSSPKCLSNPLLSPFLKLLFKTLLEFLLLHLECPCQKFSFLFNQWCFQLNQLNSPLHWLFNHPDQRFLHAFLPI